MTIAGIKFNIQSDCELFTPDAEGARAEFVNSADVVDANIDVNVNVVSGDVPDLSVMEKVFDADTAWSMYRDGADRCIARIHPKKEMSPLWVARVDDSGTEVTIYCDPEGSSEGAPGQSIINPLMYPLDQLLVMGVLAEKSGVLVHAAGIVDDRFGVVLLGQSGAGKSTLSELVLDRNDLSILSDDRIVIRKENDKYYMYGTPWPGDAGIARNEKRELKSLMFLNQSADNSVEKLSSKETFERLMAVSSIPWYDQAMMSGMMVLFENMVNELPGCKFNFRRDAEAADQLQELFTSMT